MIRVSKVRKARGNSRCNLCGHMVRGGQLIAQLGATWVHCHCAINWLRTRKARHDAAESTPTTGPEDAQEDQ